MVKVEGKEEKDPKTFLTDYGVLSCECQKQQVKARNTRTSRNQQRLEERIIPPDQIRLLKTEKGKISEM